NALLIGAELARVSGHPDRASAWSSLAAQARASVLRVFWCEDRGHLADVVNGETRDLSLRPYQLFAIGLPHVVIPREKAIAVLAAVKRGLLTPRGLRTLAPGEAAYHGSCAGTAHERVWSSQQGGVWPGFMGVYFDALVRVYGEEGKREAREWL